MVSNPTGEGAYTVEQFGTRFGMSRRKVYAELAAGRLRAKKSNRKTLIPHSVAQAWLETLPDWHPGSSVGSQGRTPQ